MSPESKHILENNETNINNFISKPLDVVLSNIKTKTKSVITKKDFIDKMFRFNDYENHGKGFHMEQQIGNCYLIAAINAMRLDKNFIDNLYKNIEIIDGDNPFKTKIGYNFPDGEYVEVKLSDLKTQKDDLEERLKDLESKTGEKKTGEVLNILTKKILNGEETNLVSQKDNDFSFDYECRENSRGEEKIHFNVVLYKEISQQIENKSGIYYDLLIKNNIYKSVKAPIGYKIIEALYIKKELKTNNRKKKYYGK